MREAARELDIARGAGADVVRVDVAWSSLELQGKGRWSRAYARRLDAFVRNARARGLRVVAVLTETPCWASKAPQALRQGCFGDWWNRGVTRFPPRRSRDYADAAVYVARRWGPSLEALEIWNEPNATVFLRSPDPVRDYARLVRSSYRRVKHVAPRLTVLAGALALSDGEFLTGLYERGRIGGHYDAISYHPYADGADPAIAEHPRGVHQRTEIVGTLTDDLQKGGFRLIPSALTPELPGALKFRQVAFFKRAGSFQHRGFYSVTRLR
jgi:hypothetical protein